MASKKPARPVYLNIMKTSLKKTKNKIWQFQSQIISEALKAMGYKTIYGTDQEDRVEFDSKAVFINSRNHPENKFYTLLHEYGHAYIFENLSEKFAADHPMYFRNSDGQREKSKSARVSIVAEEIEAWKIGRQFARNLYMHIDEEKYDKHMTENLMSYINWASNPKDF